MRTAASPPSTRGCPPNGRGAEVPDANPDRRLCPGHHASRLPERHGGSRPRRPAPAHRCMRHAALRRSYRKAGNRRSRGFGHRPETAVNWVNAEAAGGKANREGLGDHTIASPGPRADQMFGRRRTITSRPHGPTRSAIGFASPRSPATTASDAIQIDAIEWDLHDRLPGGQKLHSCHSRQRNSPILR